MTLLQSRQHTSSSVIHSRHRRSYFAINAAAVKDRDNQGTILHCSIDIFLTSQSCRVTMVQCEDPDSASVMSRMTISTISTNGTHSQVPPLMTSDTIVVPSMNGNIPPPPDTKHRAVHQIRRSALSHNYSCVESAANRQKCSVIVVVKADGYGHGAIQTALHLADSCGADAFAVATLEEAIALRRAFESNPPAGRSRNGTKRAGSVSNLFLAPGTAPSDPRSRSASPITNTRSMRSPHIRIIVLGPPVGYPRCFDDYYYYNVEVMVSGPEVARAIMEWVANPLQRKRTLVERAAQEAKQKALLAHPTRASMVAASSHGTEEEDSSDRHVQMETMEVKKPIPHAAATLSNMSGQDLAKEVRAILMNQHAASAKNAEADSNTNSGVSTPLKPASTNTFQPVPAAKPPSPPTSAAPPLKGETFGGIEAAAKTSRIRHIAAAKASEVFVEDECSETTSSTASVSASTVGSAVSRVKRRLRWHALVDSGMGRLGFRTEPLPQTDTSGARNTVDIIKEMVDAEVHTDAPLGSFQLVAQCLLLKM